MTIRVGSQPKLRRLVPAAALALVFGAATVTSGCAGLYSGKPERIKKPSKKKMPEEVATGPVEIKWVDDCSAKFQEEVGKAMDQHRRGQGKAKRLTNQGIELLEKADKEDVTEKRAGLTMEAISTLRDALIEDPYHAEATYNLAVAYTRARRKGCALALLKRLADLEVYPDFAGDAKRMINQARDDRVFSPFRKDADAAIGR